MVCMYVSNYAVCTCIPNRVRNKEEKKDRPASNADSCYTVHNGVQYIHYRIIVK